MNMQPTSEKPKPRIKVVPIALCAVLLGAVVAIGLRDPVLSKDARYQECRAHLKSWLVAQRAYYAEHDAYLLDLKTIGFSPEVGNRYAYFTGPGPLDEKRDPNGLSAHVEGIGVDTKRFPGGAITFAQLPPDVARQVGLSGTCPQCQITMACAAQLDDDATLDVWSISTGDRRAGGALVPAELVFLHSYDEAL